MPDSYVNSAAAAGGTGTFLSPYNTLSAGIAQVTSGFTLFLAGTFNFTASLTIQSDKVNITIAQTPGAVATLVWTPIAGPSGGTATNAMFVISGAGIKLKELTFSLPTMITGGSLNLVRMDAINQVVSSCIFKGPDNYNYGTMNNTIRGLEISKKNNGGLVEKCQFSNLRQPAYINGGQTAQYGNIAFNDNVIRNTKGFVVDGPYTGASFFNNSWGPNYLDIVLLSAVTVGSSLYADLTTLSQNNNSARIQDQRITPNVTYQYVPVLAYSPSGSNAIITGLGTYSATGPLVIPSTVDGRPVVAISANAFVDKSGLTSVTIPASVTSIGASAFSGCTGLTEFIVDSNNQNYIGVDGVLFNKNRTILIQFPANKLVVSYTIPDSVTSIGFEAFNGCTGLTSVTIPASVTSIGFEAFEGCTGVVSAYFLGDSVEYTDNAFNPTTTQIYVKAASNWTATTWGGCTVIKVKITTPPISTAYSTGTVTLINSSLTPKTTTVPVAGTFSWESATFAGAGTYNVKFTPDNTTLQTLGYSYVAGIEVNVLMTTGVPAGYTLSISGTGNVTIMSAPISSDGTLTIPPIINGSPVTSIAPGAFQNNTTLTSVSFPASITYIGPSSFDGCSSLLEVTVPTNVSIGPGAFAGCTDVKYVAIGDSGASRSYKSRYAAMRETPVINDVTVGKNAFEGNTSLTAVRIGENVTSIGTGAFNLCSNLISVYFLGNAIPEDSQFDASTTTIIYVKKGSSGWGNTFSGCPVIKVDITTLPTSTPIVIGNPLSTSTLNQETATATVPGNFSWNEPTQIFEGAGNYDVKFTPTDPELSAYSFVFSVAVAVAVKHNYTVYFRK